MYLGAGGTKTAAEAKVVGTAVSFVPVVGQIAGPIIAAVGSLVPMLSGKAHYSPWNFLYDDYPQHIYENEAAIVTLKNAINKIAAPGSPDIPTPPMYSKTGGTQYQASMQAIVPRYVPGSGSQIASYNRALNEAGGAYEKTVGAQLALIPQLQAQLQQVQQQTVAQQAVPIQGSATAPAPQSAPVPAFQAPSVPFFAPAPQQPVIQSPVAPAQNLVTAPQATQPLFQSAVYQPPNINVTTPGATSAQPMNITPFIIGGVALLAVVMLSVKKGR